MRRQPRYFLAPAALALLVLAGCTTMKAIEATGDELSKGNIFTGVY